MIFHTMRTLLAALLALVRATLMPRASLALENAALRQQLTICRRTQERTRLPPKDRLFWVALHRIWSDCTHSLIIVKPATVLGWHRQGFKAMWRRKSRPGRIGRPRIPRKHIALIKRISGDHPGWGEDKIAEELAAKFGIQHSPGTIRRYMVPRTPCGDQTWRTFVRNHAKELWACDFLTQYTALFAIAYIFVIMEIDMRRIVFVNVTTTTTLPWAKQQIREATGTNNAPRFLVHDNDGIFGQYGKRMIVADDDRTRSYRCHLDRWLGEVMCIKGVPIPYGAPNASPHVERFKWCASIAGHPWDPRPVSGTATASAARRKASGSPGPRWRSTRLPTRRVDHRSAARSVHSMAGETAPHP